jgi:hypothetical protein
MRAPFSLCRAAARPAADTAATHNARFFIPSPSETAFLYTKSIG